MLRQQNSASTRINALVFHSQDTEISKITIQVYMCDVAEADGGQTVFLADHGHPGPNVAVVPKVGRVLLFEHPLLHEGALVTGDCFKYAMRSDIMYKPRDA